LGRRLANLGFRTVPPIDAIGTSAVDRLLSPDAARDLAARFDAEWRKTAETWVGVGQ
jgi:hypothetical protein